MSKIRESARLQLCTIRIEGACNFNPETTVWAHANGSAPGKGIGMKSHDLLGAYACSACHDVYDRRRPAPVGLTREGIELDFWRGHARSLVLLIEQGLIVMERGKAVIA